MDYNNHNDMLQALKDCQNVEHDNREKCREAHLFVTARDGQWEPYWWNLNDRKPRYTFDLTTPIIDQISGEMEQADFDISIKPGNGKATKEVAETYDGLVRNIENISNAKRVFSNAGRNMVTTGLDGWRIVQKYVEDDSFDQDLMIEPIPDFIDRVWFDQAAQLQDKSDAQYCFVLQSMSKDAYKEMFPDRAAQSVEVDRQSHALYYHPDTVIVGEFYYIKKRSRELVLMSNGATYEDNDEFKKIIDELTSLGVTEVKRRKRDKNVVCRRLFDNDGWLDEKKETVFQWLPVIPVMANYKVIENKVVYYGAVEKQIDPQRVLNYSLSREIEEGALAPRAKYWMTQKQAAGYEKKLATMNTNTDPVQFFNPDGELPGPPMQQGGAQVNPGLRTISESMRTIINGTAGLFSANMGDNPGLQSGVAIEKLQNKGDTGTHKYFSAMECAIAHTGRILVDAIPEVYGGERQAMILGEDGSQEVVTLNQQVPDQQTGEMVTINDLSQGIYNVSCSSGPSFQNRQQETVAGILEMAQVDPEVLALGKDILLNNTAAPGMSLIAERVREQLFNAGVIPIDQMTDEEKQKAVKAAQEEQNQEGQPDPNMLIGQAELKKALVEEAKLQLDQQKLQLEGLRLQNEIDRENKAGQVDAFEAETDRFTAEVKAEEVGANVRLKSVQADKAGAEIIKSLQEMSIQELSRAAGGDDGDNEKPSES